MRKGTQSRESAAPTGTLTSPGQQPERGWQVQWSLNLRTSEQQNEGFGVYSLRNTSSQDMTSSNLNLGKILL